jgi:nucleoside-diphosphate-sugar epimerase/predicted dehydrogenase
MTMLAEQPMPSFTALDGKIGKILILGGGAVVKQCFLPAFVELGLEPLTTVVEPRPDQHGFEKVRIVVDDFRSFASSNDLSRFSHCIVALPNSLHHEAVSEALRRGLHVLCEKPLALRASECQQLAELAEKQERVLAINMVRRLFHTSQIALDVIRNGWLGALRLVRMSHGGSYAWPVSSLAPFDPINGGVLADMGIHYLDLAEMLFGGLRPVSYRDDCAGGVESECEFELNGDSSLPVTLSLSRTRTLKNQIEIVGSTGTLRIGVDSFDRCALETAPGETITLSGPEATRTCFEDYFAKQVSRFLHASFGSDHGLANAQSAACSVGLIEWAYSNRQKLRPERRFVGTREHLSDGGIYVTGATGFIGSHLMDRLNRDGATDITAGYHSLKSCAGISRYSVSFHNTDLLNPAHVQQAVRGRRYVFHLAYGREADARSITVQGTKNVVEAAVQEGVEAVVVLSTMYVLGHPGGLVDETHEYQPFGGVYGAAKAEMERWCLDRAKRSGKTRIVVLLPTCVYGPRGKTYTETPASLAREGRFCWIAGGCGIANVNYVENLVDAMILAALRTEAHGRRFIINDECLSWRDFLTPIVEPWLDSIPKPSPGEFAQLCAPPPGPGMSTVLKAMLQSREFTETLRATWLANQLRPAIKKYAPGLARLRPPVARPTALADARKAPPPWLAEVYGGTTTRFSSESARAVLGWKPRIACAEAMEETLNWLWEQGLHPRV